MDKVHTIIEWTPVTEKAHPDHGGQVLITFKLSDNFPDRFVGTARWEKGHWDWNSKVANENRRDSDVLAFAPLPNAFQG